MKNTTSYPGFMATAMAVRSYKYEVPVMNDVHMISQCILRALKDVPSNFIKQAGRYPEYEQNISKLGCPKELVEKYSDLDVTITRGSGSALAYFVKPNTIILQYVPGLVDDATKDYRSALRGLDVVITHETRHFVDYNSNLHRKAIDAKKDVSDSSFKGYWNKEYEIDARLTSLLLRVDRLYKGSALLALQGKVDALTKEHRKLLLGRFFDFFIYLASVDSKLSVQNLSLHLLDAEGRKEVEGKCEEFFKYLKIEYGMALKTVKSDQVTNEMKKAWTELHQQLQKQGSRDRVQNDSDDKAQIKKIVVDGKKGRRK